MPIRTMSRKTYAAHVCEREMSELLGTTQAAASEAMSGEMHDPDAPVCL